MVAESIVAEREIESKKNKAIKALGNEQGVAINWLFLSKSEHKENGLMVLFLCLPQKKNFISIAFKIPVFLGHKCSAAAELLNQTSAKTFDVPVQIIPITLTFA